MGELWKLKVAGLLVEGGALTLNAFMDAKLVDRLELYVAPMTLGAGPSWLEGGNLSSLSDAPRFKLIQTKRLGEDIRLSYILV